MPGRPGCWVQGYIAHGCGQVVEADRRVLEAVKQARSEAESRAEDAQNWDAAGMDATGRRLLLENRSLAQELQLHIGVGLAPQLPETSGQGFAECALENQVQRHAECFCSVLRHGCRRLRLCRGR
jgi:hypothetical protein